MILECCVNTSICNNETSPFWPEERSSLLSCKEIFCRQLLFQVCFSLCFEVRQLNFEFARTLELAIRNSVVCRWCVQVLYYQRPLGYANLTYAGLIHIHGTFHSLSKQSPLPNFRTFTRFNPLLSRYYFPIWGSRMGTGNTLSFAGFWKRRCS